MRLTEDMRAVIVHMQKGRYSSYLISPNFVNAIANEMGIELTSEQVVYISDNFKK